MNASFDLSNGGPRSFSITTGNPSHGRSCRPRAGRLSPDVAAEESSSAVRLPRSCGVEHLPRRRVVLMLMAPPGAWPYTFALGPSTANPLGRFKGHARPVPSRRMAVERNAIEQHERGSAPLSRCRAAPRPATSGSTKARQSREQAERRQLPAHRLPKRADCRCPRTQHADARHRPDAARCAASP